jgi:polar amino acid transport system permease protein
VALSLVAGAYLAETIRAGIEAVPRGQIEAARSLGMTHAQTLRFVVVPQAFRVVIPPLTNELVLLLKDTALLSVLGTTIDSKELTQFGRSNAQDFNGTSLVVAGAMYLAITIPLTRLVAVLERRTKAAR